MPNIHLASDLFGFSASSESNYWKSPCQQRLLCNLILAGFKEPLCHQCCVWTLWVWTHGNTSQRPRHIWHRIQGLSSECMCVSVTGTDNSTRWWAAYLSVRVPILLTDSWETRGSVLRRSHACRHVCEGVCSSYEEINEVKKLKTQYLHY